MKTNMMKKKMLLSLAVIAISGAILNANIFNDIGHGFEKAGDAIADTAKKAGNAINDNVIKPIGEGWELKRKIGGELDDGADLLEGAPDMLTDNAVNGLQAGLVDGINNSLMKTIIQKAGEISDQRDVIAQNKKMIQDNQDLANQLGKASLAQDLIDGFDAADQALSMLWAGPNIKTQLQPPAPTAAAPQTAFGALRQKLIQTAQNTANVDADTRNKMIQADKNDGILWQLLNAGITVINSSETSIGTIKDQINQLKDKINTSPTSLPTRMRSLGKLLKV